MTDAARDFFYLYFEQFYSLGNEKNMDKALRAEANSKQYHPICEYLNRLEWDGTERIRYVLKRYMGADDSDMVYECLKHFMMEALLRIFKPGCKADEMLCLVGTQGAGKSTFFRFLAIKDEWFSDDLRDLGDKKIYEKLRGHWIMEMSEMIAAISAKSNEEIKSFLSRQKDTFRNSCKDKGSLLKLPKEMESQIIEYRIQFMQEDTMAGQVQGWLDGYAGTYVCSRQIWKEAFNHYDGEPKKYETNEICQIMDTQIIGWKRGGYHRFSKEGFGTQRCWTREGKDETETVNQPDKDGFIKLTEGEQMKIPFD